jgi:hypothetical protein
MVDWTKPILFAKSQEGIHPRLLGNFIDNEGYYRYVVVGRSWLDSNKRYSFLVYDDDGKTVGENNDTGSSGIFDPTIINGQLVYEKTKSGAPIVIRYEGDKAVAVSLIKD